MPGPALTRYRYDVFLSHSSADKPVVRELAEGLRRAGLRVWLDEWIIQPGELISAKIEEGLEHSAVLLLCMSANAFGSDWVSLEHHTAIFRDPQNLERRFVPLRLDDAPIKAILRGYAYIDWRPAADREEGWRKLLDACGMDLGDRDPFDLDGGVPSGERQSAIAVLPSKAARSSRPVFEDSTHEPIPSRPLNFLHRGLVRSVRLNDAGERFVSGGDDGTVRLWESATGRSLVLLEGHKGRVLSVCWSGDGSRVVSGAEDGTVRLWEAATGQLLAVLVGHEVPVLTVCWSIDNEQVVSGGMDGMVRLWDVASRQEVALFPGHNDWVRSVGFNFDGQCVASGGDDGTVRLWERKSGRELAVLQGHKGMVLTVCWSADGERVASGGDDGTVRLWNAASGRQVAVLEGHAGRVCSVCWCGDGQRVVSGGADGKVRLWEAESGLMLAVFEGHDREVNSVGWSEDTGRIMSAGTAGIMRFWEPESGGFLESTIATHKFVSDDDFAIALQGGLIKKWRVRQILFREVISDHICLDMVKIPSIQESSLAAAGNGEIGDVADGALTSISGEYLLSVRTITNCQWRVVSKWPSRGRSLPVSPSEASGDELPATGINLDDALEFCRRLSFHTGRYYELPTEAQWEHACRAGSTSAYSWGESWSASLAAGTANHWGLRHMHGGVWEWCRGGGLRGGSRNDPTERRHAFGRAEVNDPLHPSSVGLRVCCLPIGTPFKYLEASRLQWRPLITSGACEKVLGISLKEAHYADLLRGFRMFRILSVARMRLFLATVATSLIMERSAAFALIGEPSVGPDFENSFDLGNYEPGDGERYTGAGALLLTGRAAYTAFAEAIGDDRILNGAEVVADKYPYSSAAFRWSQSGGNDHADSASEPKIFWLRMKKSPTSPMLPILIEAYERAVIAFPDPA